MIKGIMIGKKKVNDAIVTKICIGRENNKQFQFYGSVQIKSILLILVCYVLPQLNYFNKKNITISTYFIDSTLSHFCSFSRYLIP